jgi:hypothetical protein
MQHQTIEAPDQQNLDVADDGLMKPFNRVNGSFEEISWKEMMVDDKIYIAKVFLARRDASGGKIQPSYFSSRYGWDSRSFQKLVSDVDAEMKMEIVLPFPFEPIRVDEDGRVHYRKLRTGPREFFINQNDGIYQYGKLFPREFVDAIMEVYEAHKSSFSMQYLTFFQRYGILKETWQGWCANAGNAAKANGTNPTSHDVGNVLETKGPNPIHGAGHAAKISGPSSSLKRKSKELKAGTHASPKRQSNAVPLSPIADSTSCAQFSSFSSSASSTRNDLSSTLMNKIDFLQTLIRKGRKEKEEEREASLKKLLKLAAMKQCGAEKIQIVDYLCGFLSSLGETMSDGLEDIYLEVLSIKERIQEDQDFGIDQQSGWSYFL